MDETRNELKYFKYKSYTRKNLEEIRELKNLPEQLIEDVKLVSLVLPFRTNSYVLEELIDWKKIPNDPIFKINFPSKKMLEEEHYDILRKSIESGDSDLKISNIVSKIHHQLNPHPGGQVDYNIPIHKGEKLNGIQHKYRETVLAFPSEGQVCHAFCTYCFRWAQFVGQKDFKIVFSEPEKLVEYIQESEEVQDILFTGGDPMIMKAMKLSKYIKPILEAKIPHLNSIRIGTKALTYWPYRFISDSDTEEILQLFNEIIDSNLHLTIIANMNHPNELKTEAFRKAINKIYETGAVIRTQSPLLKNINDNANVWVKLWKKQVNLGMVPYYMFIVRNTGAKKFFEVPLVEALRIFKRAYRRISGLGRTVKGPIMSTTLGKVKVAGITNIGNKRVIVLQFIQGRNPNWVGRPFFVKYNTKATWFNELEPAFNERFWFEYDSSKYLAPYSRKIVQDINEIKHKSEQIKNETQGSIKT